MTGASASPLDVTASKHGTTQPTSTGTTAITARASEIAIGDIGWKNSVTPSSQTADYTTTAVEQSTVSGSATGEQAAWQLLSATGTQTYGATLSSPTVGWTATMATFRVASAAPTITSFSPTSGTVGTSVVIDGSGFTGASAVAFSSTAAIYAVQSDSKISTTVPSAATSGPITVTAQGGTVTSTSSFTVNPSSGTPIQHVVYILQENHSFDNVLGALCAQTGRCDGATTGTLSTGTTIPLSKASDAVPNVAHLGKDQVRAVDGARWTASR